MTFAGDTHFAYPFVHAAINAVSLHSGSHNRIIDLSQVVPILLKAINAMLDEIKDLAVGMDDFEEPELRLIFGGYSWRSKKFRIWKFHFNVGERQFRQVEVREWEGLGKSRYLVVIGDPEASRSALRRAERKQYSAPTADEDVQTLAKKRLIELLESRGIRDGVGLNMEPFEVLRDLTRDDISPHIGGPPQLVKVYQHMNVQPFGVRWSEARNVAVLGRSLTLGEKMHVPILDPDTLQTENPKRRPKSAVDGA